MAGVRLPIPAFPSSDMPDEVAFRRDVRATFEAVDGRLMALSALTGDGDPTEITGSTGGNAALQNLLAALEAYGLIIDSTT